MKKRSLFAAVAMLIVSAIVLTSVTYAWFASSTSASVETISASVTNNKGAIQLVPTTHAKSGAQPATTLSATTHYNAFPEALNPVSLQVASGSVSTYKVDYDNFVFTAAGAGTANTDYINFGFEVQYTAQTVTQQVDLTPTLYTAQGVTNPQFGYALVRISDGAATPTYTDHWYQYSSGGYTPLTAVDATTGCKDLQASGEGHAIVDTNDESDKYTLGTANSTWATSGQAFQIIAANANAGGTYTVPVEVYLWVEGNDPQCTGAVSAQQIGISFAVGFHS